MKDNKVCEITGGNHLSPLCCLKKQSEVVSIGEKSYLEAITSDDSSLILKMQQDAKDGKIIRII